MPADNRDAVLSNARYLRNVRPIDPEEIAEYVEGHPHPAVVRRTLREEALGLGLVERDDGTFAPPPDGRVDATFDGVERLPEAYVRRVEDLLVERHGADWHAGESGARLRERIRRLKERYYRQHSVEYDPDVALAYAVYHLADNYAVGAYVTDELGRDGLLDHDLRVLDVGAGVGGPALGLHDYLPDDALVEYHAVEPSAAADVLENVLEEAGRNFRASVHRETAEAFDPGGVLAARDDGREGFDLVCFYNVLSELDAPADVVEAYLDALASDGTVVAVAPADRNTSIGLREVERELVDERGVADAYAPTVRLWPGERPTDRGWSFDERPGIEVPAFQERLATDADEPDAFRNASVRYSFSLLRTDDLRRYDYALDAGRYARMADSGDHVTERVDLVACKLSRDLSGGDRPLFKVSDGSESTDHYAVLVRETVLNERLRRADYGALLSFENALVLWNEDEEAYNVVVDEETVIDPA